MRVEAAAAVGRLEQRRLAAAAFEACAVVFLTVAKGDDRTALDQFKARGAGGCGRHIYADGEA